MQRILGLLGMGVVGLFAACGGADPGATLDDTATSGGTGGSGAEGGSSGSGAGGTIHWGGSGNQCTPKTCAEADVECGVVADGCGDVIDCGGCDDGEVCGVQAANVCSDPADLCEPLSEEEVCAGKECGSESDGCSATIDCGSCDAGEACGARAAFQCDPPGGTCTPIESCAALDKECGFIGDGCGGVIDCDAETGGCAEGTYCGILNPSECDEPPACEPTASSCAELGWECGTALNNCGQQFSCADEGRGCKNLELCVGGINAPTQCVSAFEDCPLCQHVPDCSSASQPTRLSGRVVTPGRSDDNTGNQVGVPNAVVYILRSNDPSTLPAIPEGLPDDGESQSCDRCEDAPLGPSLVGAVTNAEGEYTIEGNIPVGEEFLLVVKAGKFRRAQHVTLDEAGACATTQLPTAVTDGNPTRLPRALDDGLGVHIPRVAVTTGNYDGMECVFEKLGIQHALFTNPLGAGRIHLYRDNGAWSSAEDRSCVECSECDSNSCRRAACTGCAGCDSAECTSCQADALDACESAGQVTLRTDMNPARLHENGGRIGEYDMVVSDCRGNTGGTPAAESSGSANVRRYVNRGGRFFASHYAHNWIQSGSASYDPESPLDTGLNPAVTWADHDAGIEDGTGVISENPPRSSASPRIQTFIDWMVREDAVTSADDLTFNIPEPRSRATTLGPYTEEFVHCDGGVCDRTSRRRPQQVAFYTPYAAPEEAAACGRVVYSGFHVSVTGSGNWNFPEHCNGDLSPTEKTLLFMLFDLGACIGEVPPPSCTPETECPAGACGVTPDGCGNTLDCGPCIPTCMPLSCDDVGAECGSIGDGCGNVVPCGDCDAGEVCGADAPNQCGSGSCTPSGCPEDAECGQAGDGCGDIVDCGTCPEGYTCGGNEPYKCAPPPGCVPVSCESVGAECGSIPDGCGSVKDCGDCPRDSFCGVSKANKCETIK